MNEIECKIAEAWRLAADDLCIEFTSPFKATIFGDAEYIGFVHHFGRRIGTIISVLDKPSSLVDRIDQSKDENYYFSELGLDYCDYNRQLFIDTLDDWQFFGPDSERPSWYTGKSWGEKHDT